MNTKLSANLSSVSKKKKKKKRPIPPENEEKYVVNVTR